MLHILYQRECQNTSPSKSLWLGPSVGFLKVNEIWKKKSSCIPTNWDSTHETMNENK